MSKEMKAKLGVRDDKVSSAKFYRESMWISVVSAGLYFLILLLDIAIYGANRHWWNLFLVGLMLSCCVIFHIHQVIVWRRKYYAELIKILAGEDGL